MWFLLIRISQLRNNFHILHSHSIFSLYHREFRLKEVLLENFLYFIHLCFVSINEIICFTVTPHRNCRLKLLKLERIKDFLLMEEEFIQNQERLKPQEEKHEVR